MGTPNLEELHLKFTPLSYSHTSVIECIRQACEGLNLVFEEKRTQGTGRGETSGKVKVLILSFEVEYRSWGDDFSVEKLEAALEISVVPLRGTDLKVKVEVKNERGIVVFDNLC